MTSALRSSLICATTFALCLAAAPVKADGPAHERSEESRFALGLGLVSEASPYRGVDTETKVLPLLMYENHYVRLFGPHLDLKLPSAGPVSFALTAKYSDEGYKASDADELHGMAERKDGFWLGAKAKWRNPMVDISAALLGDASNNSGGQQIKLEASKGFGLGARMRLEPRIALTWLDKDYVDHFYGVKAGEATTGRAAYAGASSMNTELGLRLNTQLAPRHGLMVDFKHTVLGSGIKNSPLVDSSGVSSVFLGYLYQF